MWYKEFNAVFWITLATLLTGSLGLAIKFCLKSKCEHFSVCFGILKIDRRVDLEVQEEMKELELGAREEDEQKK
jgi:hypothetical protein